MPGDDNRSGINCTRSLHKSSGNKHGCPQEQQGSWTSARRHGSPGGNTLCDFNRIKHSIFLNGKIETPEIHASPLLLHRTKLSLSFTRKMHCCSVRFNLSISCRFRGFWRQVGAGEWDRGSNPTGAKISLNQVFTFTNSHSVTFVPPLPPPAKDACALQVATQVIFFFACLRAPIFMCACLLAYRRLRCCLLDPAAILLSTSEHFFPSFPAVPQPQVPSWNTVATKHAQQIPLDWQGWSENGVSVSTSMWVDGKRLSAAELRVANGQQASGNDFNSTSNTARRRSSVSSSHTDLTDDSSSLIEVMYHSKNVVSSACASSKAKPHAELPLPLRVQSEGLYFSRKSFDIALAHAPFLSPPNMENKSYVASGAAARCAYLFMRRPLLFSHDRCVGA